MEKSERRKLHDPNVPTFIVDELRNYGIANIGQLKAILPNKVIQAYLSKSESPNARGLIRSGMLLDNLEKALIATNITAATTGMIDLLSEKYSRKAVERLFAEKEIKIAEARASSSTSP